MCRCMGSHEDMTRVEKLEQAIEDALDDFDEAATDGPGGEDLPMLNRNIIAARHRLEDALEGEYPW